MFFFNDGSVYTSRIAALFWWQIIRINIVFSRIAAKEMYINRFLK